MMAATIKLLAGPASLCTNIHLLCEVKVVDTVFESEHQRTDLTSLSDLDGR